MPLFDFVCSGCGFKIEVLTRSITAVVPATMSRACTPCGRRTSFYKAMSAPAVRTSGGTERKRRKDFQRKNPNWKENVVAGRTAAGRQLGSGGDRQDRYVTEGRRPNGSVVPSLVNESGEHWVDGFTSSPTGQETARAAKEVARMRGQ